jgi:hypothetical protein
MVLVDANSLLATHSEMIHPSNHRLSYMVHRNSIDHENGETAVIYFSIESFCRLASTYYVVVDLVYVPGTTDLSSLGRLLRAN